ncbi:MAG TPA: hypothetical protein PKB10_11530 [Tepidisphaeraceae bacterium]|nr:hypothetical protein [Tepidisphaeraceae bacterium]
MQVSDSVGPSTLVKRCVKCGQDVTHAKRMKDSVGRYWCYECGAQDEARKGNAMMAPCSSCGAPTAPQHLYRHGKDYLSAACHEEAGPSGKKSGGDRTKLVLVLLCVLVGVGLAAMYALGIL